MNINHISKLANIKLLLKWIRAFSIFASMARKFESRKQPLMSQADFVKRMLQFALYSFLIVGFSMALGVVGYMYFGDLNFIDAFHMSALILTGMGPVAEMKTVAAKLFSSFYALYSGVAFLTMMATFLAPILHRLLHILHLDDEE